jgi:hypothetical protein
MAAIGAVAGANPSAIKRLAGEGRAAAGRLIRANQRLGGHLWSKAATAAA